MVYIKKRIFPMKEKSFMLKFMEKLKAKSSRTMWYFKTHGEPMQVRGVPDILACYFGLWLSIEFKIKRHGKLTITPYQQYTAECLQKANAIHLSIWFDEDTAEIGIGMRKFENLDKAVDWLIEVLESALRIPCNDRKGEQ